MFVRLSADISGVERNMAAVRKSFSEVGHAAEKMGRSLAIGVTAPLAAFGALSVRSATQLDSLKRGLTSVAGSSAEAEKQLGRLAEIAKLPGLGFREAIQGSIRLQAAGFSASLAEDALRGFANALATVGGSQADLDRVTRALSQIAAKGKVSAEEINQLAETIPQIRVVMKDAFGTANTEELQKLGIEAETFIRKVTDSLLELEQVTSGPQKAFEDLQDAVFRASAALGNQLLPVVLPIVEGLAAMLEQVRELDPKTVKLGIALAAVAAVAGPLLIVFGSLTTAVAALSTAIGVGLLPLITVGGGVAIALGALAALFVQNKINALEAAAAVDKFTASLKGSRAAQEAQLLELSNRRIELKEQLSKEPEEIVVQDALGISSSRVANPARERLQGEVDRLTQQTQLLIRNFREVEVAAEDTPVKFVDVAAAAEALKTQLEAATGKIKDVKGAFTSAADAAAQAATDLMNAQLADFAASTRALAEAARIRTEEAGFGKLKGQKGFLEAAANPEGLGAQLKGLVTQFTGLSGAIGPVAVAAIALKPVFDGLREALGETLSKLTEPLKAIGRIIGSLIVPILEVLEAPLKAVSQLFGILAELLRPFSAMISQLLFPFAQLTPVLELLAKAVSYVSQGLGYFVRALGIAVDKLVPDRISKVGKGLAETGQSMIDNAKAFRDGTLEFGKATDALKEFSDTLSTGIPQGFRVLNLELAKFDSSRAVPFTGPVGAAAAGSVQVSDHRQTTIQIYQQPGEDQDAFVRKIEGIMDRRDRQMGLTYAGNPYALLRTAR